MPTTHTPETIGYLLEQIKDRISGDDLAEMGFYDQEPFLAAAPALYAALKVLLVNRDVGEYESQKQGLPRMIEALDQAHAALAAADGREQP